MFRSALRARPVLQPLRRPSSRVFVRKFTTRLNLWDFDEKAASELAQRVKKTASDEKTQNQLLEQCGLTKDEFCDGAQQAYKRIAQEFNRAMQMPQFTFARPASVSRVDTVFLPTYFDPLRELTFDVLRWSFQKEIEAYKNANKEARITVEAVESCELLRVQEASRIKCGSFMVQLWLRMMAKSLFRVTRADVLLKARERFVVNERKTIFNAQQPKQTTDLSRVASHVLSFIHLHPIDKQQLAQAGSMAQFRTDSWLLFDFNNSHGSL